MKIHQLKIIVFFSITIICLLCVPSYSKGEVNGKISFVSGKVTINGKIAQKGDIVKFGDEIISADNKSACKIIIGDNSIMKIQSHARIIFNIDKTPESHVKVRKGWFSAVFNKRKVSIRTPTVTAGVRGTVLCIKVENDESSYTCTCNGTIHWQGKGHDREDVISASHHFGMYYKLVDGKPVSSRAGMLFHDDKSVESIAEDINVKIDWTKHE